MKEYKEKIYKEKRSGIEVIIPGNPSGLPDAFFRVAVFIDNAYLLRLKNHFFKKKFKYNLKKFLMQIAEKHFLLIEVIFLYDAPPFQSENPNDKERKSKKNYDKYAEVFKSQGIILREGRTQRIKANGIFIYKQKGVDMLLGIDAVSVKHKFNKVTGVVLLTGDSDFVPLVEKLKEQNLKVFLWTYFNRDRHSPFSRSNHLIKSVSKYVKLTKENFAEAANEI